MFKKLLVPVDLSPQSMMMVDIATRMEGYGVKEVMIYSALDHVSKRDPLLKALDESIGEAGLSHELVTEVRKEPAPAILKAAESHGATMIAMAASGKGRVKEFIVGSTSLEVIRRSKLPVLLNKFPLEASDDPRGYREKSPPLLDRVLVTIDLSKASKAMLPQVQQLIDAGARKMTLFHVVQSAKYNMTDDKRFQEVKQKMETFQSKLDAKDCEIDVHLHFGTTTYNILEATREIDATLIVLGTTGKGYLRGATLGSTSEEVIKGSTRPLLLIPT
ncbi:MAG TPA: universal stress protein [Methanomassiliicoccales archaeon]|nr:universal stress protein [Methanomassiliicoccales archaeon]HNX47301.1 universal stress protein [Methanomassiliicoccales archaeon]HPR98462.1 universal stress protein [Methanomassiliicoccales archaeon]